MLKTVAVCGAFDPFRIGHLIHIREARKLGDHLVVIINTDVDVIRKRGNVDFVLQSLGERYEILKELRSVDEVVIAIDQDGTVARTLLMVKPDILAKGGDRNESNMPQSELDACKDIGCQIVYRVGSVLSSSTDVIKRIQQVKEPVGHNPSGDFS